MKKILRTAYIFWRRLSSGCRISLKSFINPSTELEGKNAINSGAVVSNSYIGYGTYIGANSILPNVKIGRFCSIANNVEVLAHTHPSKNFVSTHPAFYSVLQQAGFSYTEKQLFVEEMNVKNEPGVRHVVVENDVWIGARVQIKGGVTIGNGAIIAAGSLVTRDVKPYSIVGGVPAKLIRMRFSESQIMALNNLLWWNRSDYWLRQHVPYFSNIDELIEVVKREEGKMN